MTFQPALIRCSHWSELIKPVGFFVLLTPLGCFLLLVARSFGFPLPTWVAVLAGLLVGLLVGIGVFLSARLRFVRHTPASIALTAEGLRVTRKGSAPQFVAWKSVQKVVDDDELCGWQIESSGGVLRFGVAGLSREGMSAIEKAIRENAMTFGFPVEDEVDDASPAATSGSPIEH